ncbi:hypothetical protein NQ314_008333 [Rhamnusium bicolor]|uniref:TRAF-type domain-containing protein n=1 Tax=Rhamnusium bicolor TaxID=1586634 RepID=A0AAV8YCY2_9CUCU|nr:hypothetical protein NQ314_008333 [Rhamnusium bicolor]
MLVNMEIDSDIDAQLALPKDAINYNKCSLCQKLLSVPPIMTASSEKNQYVCGRCKDVKCETYTRNTLFENIARYLSFPCTYENCTEIIPWGLVELHEEECTHRKIRCPIYYQECDEEIEITKLKSHFEEKTYIELEIWQ